MSKAKLAETAAAIAAAVPPDRDPDRSVTHRLVALAVIGVGGLVTFLWVAALVYALIMFLFDRYTGVRSRARRRFFRQWELKALVSGQGFSLAWRIETIARPRDRRSRRNADFITRVAADAALSLRHT
jgi:hypothetical protein